MMRSPYPCPRCRLRLWMRPCRLSCYPLASSRLHLSLPCITASRESSCVKYRDVESNDSQYTSTPQVERPPATCSLVSAKKRDHLPSGGYPIGSAGRVNHVYDAGRHPPRRGRTTMTVTLRSLVPGVPLMLQLTMVLADTEPLSPAQ